MSDPKARKRLLFLCTAVVLLPLVGFKWIKGGSGENLGWIAPIGISFYTLQIIGYLLDVYRKQIAPERHFGYFALFTCFFPQLIAGPIGRAEALLPQFRSRIEADYGRTKDGILLILSGLLKKTVLADTLALVVDPVFAHPRDHSGLALLLATIFARYHLFCDFSGYTDIARGSAELFGFRLTENFRQPFFSRSIVEHWRRWHISLSTWMRDYLYLPLIASRFSRFGLYFNLILTFVILGLWHGFTVNFLIYGALQGALITLFDISARARETIAVRAGLHRFEKIHKVLQITVTFLFFVCLPTVFFKTKTVGDSLYVFGHLLSGLTGDFSRWSSLGSIDRIFDLRFFVILALIGMMEFLHFLQQTMPIRTRIAMQPKMIRLGIYAGVVIILFTFTRYKSDAAHFIYQGF